MMQGDPAGLVSGATGALGPTATPGATAPAGATAAPGATAPAVTSALPGTTAAPPAPAAAGRAMDVSGLPTYGFSHRSLMWWGTMGLMLIEGTVFAMGIMAYFYLRGLAPQWPISADPPQLLWGTLNTALLLLSLWPNHLAKRAAERRQRGRAALWVVVCVVLALVFLGLRAMEFTALNILWTENAYGALVWFLLGLHTTHLVTDTVDTAVLAVLLFTGPFDGRRYVDVSENAMYWYFVVFSWAPIYAVIYLAPRF